MILTLHLAHAIVKDEDKQVLSQIVVRNPRMYFRASYNRMISSHCYQ